MPRPRKREHLDRAKAELAGREATASFFFRSFLDSNYLTTVIDGWEEFGHDLAPAAAM